MNSNSVIENRSNQGRVFDESVVLSDNAMLKVRPDLFNEWDFIMNDDLGLDVYKITKGSGKTAHWICNKGHSHTKKICTKTGGIGCPYCSNKKLLVGYNDMWTTNPEQASLLANHEDGHKYMQSSGKKVDWKCSGCNSKILNKSIDAIKRQGLFCGSCSDGVSRPEKIMFNLLKSLHISFEHDNAQPWSNNKRYDFYLPEYSFVIETHGIQHSIKAFGTRSTEEELLNDEYKRELAYNNGIAEYIEIDCRYSEIEFIKNSILNSKMSVLFNLNYVDWEAIEQESVKSLLITACDLYNNGMTVSEISNELKVNKNAISKYLTKGNEMGICSYERFFKRKVAQLTIDNKLARIWDSLKEASDGVRISDSLISSCCVGRGKTAGGFKWLFLEDYNKYISGEMIPSIIKNLHGCSVTVVKLSTELEFIEEYDSIKMAAIENNLNSSAHITSNCRGNRKTAYGFKWMYKEDYESMVKEKEIAV